MNCRCRCFDTTGAEMAAGGWGKNRALSLHPARPRRPCTSLDSPPDETPAEDKPQDIYLELRDDEGLPVANRHWKLSSYGGDVAEGWSTGSGLVFARAVPPGLWKLQVDFDGEVAPPRPPDPKPPADG